MYWTFYNSTVSISELGNGYVVVRKKTTLNPKKDMSRCLHLSNSADYKNKKEQIQQSLPIGDLGEKHKGVNWLVL